MRRILVENARRKQAEKHGGQYHRLGLDQSDLADRSASNPDKLLALDEALSRLAVEDPAKAELVKLRYLAGLSLEQAADILGTSLATAKRRWAFARAWLYDAIQGHEEESVLPPSA